MDTAQWPQETVVKPQMEEIGVENTSSNSKPSLEEWRGVRTQKLEQAAAAAAAAALNLRCPRCNSTNTKFCYYNNYSLSQPRYFCKSCKRYWTQGGSLRNIPAGGGASRKNTKRSSSSSKKLLPNIPQNPIHEDQDQDLNLGFPSHDLKTISELLQVPNFEDKMQPSSSSIGSSSHQLSAMELLTGISNSRGLSEFMPMPISDPNSIYSSGFEFKPTLNFSVDGLGNGLYGTSDHGRVLFPFEDLKKVTSTSDIEQNREQGDSTGYWNVVLGDSRGSW